jgi:hypothetical protein
MLSIPGLERIEVGTGAKSLAFSREKYDLNTGLRCHLGKALLKVLNYLWTDSISFLGPVKLYM